MITEVGKSIIAKYLVGTTPAYASYISLGCGAQPRNNVTSFTNVDSIQFAGTISATTATTTITGIASTQGLAAGMLLTEYGTNTGSFGGTVGTTKIVSVDSSTQITIMSTALNTAGAITFTTSVFSTDSTIGLWVGARLTLVAGFGSGELHDGNNTIVNAVVSGTIFSVNYPPKVPLVNAKVDASPDPTKTEMDFEMFRVPITSRGYVNDNGVNKVVFAGQLPAEERYEVTEIGIYSAGANAAAGAYDSKMLYSFSDREIWEYHTSSSATAIPSINVPLDANNDDVISVVDASNNPIPVFQAAASNRLFTSADRIDRYERPRFFNNTIFIQGDDAKIYDYAPISSITGDGTKVTYDTGTVLHGYVVGDVVTITGVNPTGYNLSSATITDVPTPTTFKVANTTTTSYVSGGRVVKSNGTQNLTLDSTSNHIHLTGRGYDLTRNSPADEIKLAFSVISKDGGDTAQPDSVKIILDFSTLDTLNAGETARFEVNIQNGKGIGQYDLASNRYIVAKKQLQELVKTSGFNWNAVNVVKIYACAIKNDLPSDDYYVAIDAIRLDNTQTQNVLYGMTGYSIVQNGDAIGIIKNPNTTNFIEFRFIVDVT